MLWVDLEEHKASGPVALSPEDVVYLMGEHASHVSIQPQRDGKFIISAGSYVGYIVISEVVISIRPKVPNDNLIFMLSYLFHIPTGDEVRMASDADNPVLDIIAMVLITRIKQLIKRGMFRGYIRKAEYLSGVKGKIPAGRNLFFTNKLLCEYDELSYSVFLNIILKGTLRLLMSMNMSKVVKEEAKTLLMIMSEVDDVEIDERLFSRVSYSRLNLNYKPLIDFCYLIYRSINVKSGTGSIRFSSFLIDMNVVFEEFIRQYLRNNLGEYNVRRRTINNWASSSRQELLPVIEPDIVIDGKLVIDVKYYRNVVTNRGKLISSNLYQIITYMNVMNLPGMLIYPYNDIEIKNDFDMIGGNRFSVATLDLSGSFDDFNTALRELLLNITRIIAHPMAS